MSARTFPINPHTGTPNPVKYETPGPLQPPRKRYDAMAETMAMFPYSPKKNIAQRTPLYSVRYPATSSDSASGKSNGARLVSAKPQMKYTTTINGWTSTNQAHGVKPSKRKSRTA